jgi:hypothetical protein
MKAGERCLHFGPFVPLGWRDDGLGGEARNFKVEISDFQICNEAKGARLGRHRDSYLSRSKFERIAAFVAPNARRQSEERLKYPPSHRVSGRRRWRRRT